MRINLNEIPDIGRQYLFNRKTAELNDALADLIGKKEYDLDLFIKPLASGTYELLGSLKTSAPEQCSACALDFDFPIDCSFRTILMSKMPEDRTGKYARVQNVSDLQNDGLETFEVNGQVFDAGEYAHEKITLEIPFNPRPKAKANGDCSLCDKSLKAHFRYEDPGFEEKAKPLAALKNLKLQ